METYGVINLLILHNISEVFFGKSALSFSISLSIPSPIVMIKLLLITLPIKFPSLYLPGQCDVKVGQVHMVSLQDEVTIVE